MFWMKSPRFFIGLFVGIVCVFLRMASSAQQSLVVVTVATNENDGFRQFLYSTKKNGLKTEVFGMGMKWEGGDVTNTVGGGQKVNLLKEGLEKYKDDTETILMFSDSYDAVILNDEKEILRKYNALKGGVVFSAEGFCWPDKSLADRYPTVAMNEKRFLNSGGFIGNARDIYSIISHEPINNEDDDQLYYTKIFLDPILREKWNIKLDKKSELFQALNGALDDVDVKFLGMTSFLYNSVTGSRPSVVHGNGPIKPEFFRLSTYLLNGWTVTAGCLRCKEDTISLAKLKKTDFPHVLIAIFLEKPTPFVREFFENIADQTYPKRQIDVFIHSSDKYHDDDVAKFIAKHKTDYRSVQVINPGQDVAEANAKNRAIEECVRKSCNYLFMVDSLAQLTNHHILESLIQQNRSVLAPLLLRPNMLWSNFWGGLTSTGYYKRSKDYIDIVELKRVGVWNVPHASQAYLIHASVLPLITNGYSLNQLDPDMAICTTLRERGVFIHLTNRENFGHLIDNDKFDTSHRHNELYEIFSNPYNWDKRYIHPAFYEIIAPNTAIPQPCPDVYRLHVFNPEFCWDLIDEVETFNDWSGGKHEDARLAGGYENVPTDDIHLNQVGLEQQWLKFLQKYIMPLQQKVFTGYYHDPPQSHMNFVVRYKPTAQPYLRPHHDSSTFSVNVALNRHLIDFEGGGTNFLRYNCSVVGTPQGHVLIHPGKLTHYHEGLRTTNGTRYIMVSFVDP